MHGGFPVITLSERPNLEHLRKQAKDLLRLYRRHDAGACERLRVSLPAARGRNDAALIAQQLKLHDMQSCIAREHGCASWQELKDQVELQRARAQDQRTLQLYWLRLVYGGDVAGGPARPRPTTAARVLQQHPELVATDPMLACAVGDETLLRRTLDADPSWVNRSGGPLDIPPLIAVCHSTLAGIEPFGAALRRSLRLLLDRGADPNQAIGNRWPPHSLEKPGDGRLTPIYGAAGKLHDVTMTRMLLAAGADANDNESLYHSIDDPDVALPCTRLLLEAGTRVPGTNALAKVLDFDNLAGLKLLLAHVPHAHADLAHALHWAVYRGRSAAHVRALLDAGADPKSLDAHRGHARSASFLLPDVARLLGASDGETPSEAERFAAACVAGDEAAARRLLAASPDLFASLTEAQLKLLPNAAMSGHDAAVKLMVNLGWPIGTRGGDIDGSALNWAVFRGNPELTAFLLERGASFREPHGYGSDVLGTLGWASLNVPRSDGDWAGCAWALLEHGLPEVSALPDRDPTGETRELAIDGRTFVFTAEVADVLLRD
jgi:ankyrin repeat protein